MAGAHNVTLHAWLWSSTEQYNGLPPAVLFLAAVFCTFVAVQAYIAFTVARHDLQRQAEQPAPSEAETKKDN
eukprot:2252644-Prymnesium_polylepis.2